MRPLPLSVLNRNFSKISKTFISSSPVDLLGGEPPPAKPGPPSPPGQINMEPTAHAWPRQPSAGVPPACTEEITPDAIIDRAKEAFDFRL
jgi:hypothetical protein